MYPTPSSHSVSAIESLDPQVTPSSSNSSYECYDSIRKDASAVGIPSNGSISPSPFRHDVAGGVTVRSRTLISRCAKSKPGRGDRQADGTTSAGRSNSPMPYSRRYRCLYSNQFVYCHICVSP